jgi:hypothetical protein
MSSQNATVETVVLSEFENEFVVIQNQVLATEHRCKLLVYIL